MSWGEHLIKIDHTATDHVIVQWLNTVFIFKDGKLAVLETSETWTRADKSTNWATIWRGDEMELWAQLGDTRAKDAIAFSKQENQHNGQENSD